jgi:hypothetical protein
MRAWVSMVVSLVACAGLVLVGGCVLAAPVGCWMREVWLLNPPAVVVAGINMGSGAVVHHT